MNLERWFPLVPRPRPPGIRLADRVDMITQDAALAREGTGQEALDAASRVYNGAALIASDTGLDYIEFQAPFDFATTMDHDPLGKNWYISGTDDGSGKPKLWVQS